MAPIYINSFRGEAPRVSPAKLALNMSQRTYNARLLSGDLEAWKDWQDVHTLEKAPYTATIYYLVNQYWLEWSESELAAGAVEVDVARSTLGGDSSGRIFLTGLDAPRWTNIALATTGSPPFPVETRLLGVVAPTNPPVAVSTYVTGLPTSIAIVDDMTNFGNWTIPAPIAGQQAVSQDAVNGDPAPSLDMEAIVPSPQMYAVRDTGATLNAATVIEFDVYLNDATNNYSDSIGVRVMNDSLGNGLQCTFSADGTTGFCDFAVAANWTTLGSGVSNTRVDPIPLGSWFHMKVTLTPTATAGVSDVTFEGKSGAVFIFQKTMTGMTLKGSWCGMTYANIASGGTHPRHCRFDNFNFTSTQAVPLIVTPEATSYVYTFVNDQGEESAPSTASATVLIAPGAAVNVTSDTSADVAYFVTTKRIYRALTSALGTTFRFVAEIPLAQADFIDITADSALGETLASDDWDLPPTDLRGILALPNDIYVGFVRNQLCFSAQGHPHAWPLLFRQSTDKEIVGIGNIDTTVVIATQGFPYLAAGNAPGAYSMSKLELPYGCVSKRSVAYLRGFGVTYASPDGIVGVAGNGQCQIISEQWFSRKEWQALVPETMIAKAHDDRYFAFVQPDGVGSAGFGMILDFKGEGFGKVSLREHPTAVFSSEVTDTLYAALDVNKAGTVITPFGDTTPQHIWTWDMLPPTNTGLPGKPPYSWRSRIYRMRGREAYEYYCLRAAAYHNNVDQFLTLRLYADGAPIFVVNVTSGQAARMPVVDCDEFEFQIDGNVDLYSVAIANEVEELGDGP